MELMNGLVRAFRSGRIGYKIKGDMHITGLDM